MGKEVLLTVSLMTSNRKKTLVQCLESLEQLRKEISSEVVVVDTGCNQEMLDILRKYQVKVVKFQWCKDFSAARNAGLKKARGKWFLFLDDDEWFEDTDEIINFFRTGEYKNYHSASYVVRNYTKKDGSHWNDAYATRVFELYPNTAFRYKIHEEAYPICGPTKELESYVHHYGYAYETRKELYEHVQRNITPLLQEIEYNPGNIKMYVQLSQEYLGINAYEQSKMICQKGIQAYGEDREQYSYFLYLCVNAANCMNYLYDYAGVYQWVTECISQIEFPLVNRGKLLVLLTKATYELKKYKECMEAVFAYQKCLEEYKKNSKCYKAHKGIFMWDVFEDAMTEQTLMHGIWAACYEGQYKKALFLAEEIEWNQAETVLSNFEHFVRESYEATQNVREEHKILLWNKFLQYPGTIRLYQSEVEYEWKMGEQERARDMWELLTRTDCRDWYVTYAKLRSNDISESLQGTWEELAWKSPCFVQNILDLEPWKEEEQIEVDFSNVFHHVDRGKWIHNVDEMIYKTEENEWEQFIQFLEKFVPKTNLCYRYFALKLLEKQLLAQKKGEKRREYAVLREEWRTYSRECIGFYQSIYQENIFETCEDLLPVNCRLALRMIRIDQCLEEDEVGEALRCIKEAIGICPKMDLTLKEYLECISVEIRERECEREDVQTELELYLETMKKKAKEFIGMGQCDAATLLLQQLYVMMPNDPEIRELLDEIGTLDK